MLAVDVGVGHQHDLVVPQLGEVEVLADAGAERRDQRLDLLVAQRAVEAGALDVEDLAADRQDRLRARVAPAHRRAAGRVALDDEDLALLGAVRLAVRELAGHAARLEQALAAGRLARLAGRHARGGGLDRLADDVARLGRVRVEPVAELLVDDRCTNVLASVLPSLVLVWPSNCGSPSLIEMTAVRPSRMSSPVRFSSFSLRMPFSRAYRLTSEVIAARKPSSCVPPSVVEIVLAYVCTDSEYALVHCMRDLDGDPALGVLGLEVDDLGVDQLDLLRRVEVLDVVDQAAVVLVGDGRANARRASSAPRRRRPRRSVPACSGRSSVSVICRPLLRNAICWNRARSVSKSYSVVSKIAGSAQNVCVRAGLVGRLALVQRRRAACRRRRSSAATREAVALDHGLDACATAR